MHSYLDLLRDVSTTGVSRNDRTGVGTRSVFGRQMRFDLSAGFPLLTTKRIFTKSLVLELLWFLRGDTNVEWLRERGCKIWDPWADANGDLGPIYGHQWRSWPSHNGESIDQIQQVIETIKTNPNSRRIVVSAWNPSDLDKMALAPCHCLFQFYVADGKLSCQLYQRSCDVFIGLAFNIPSYALLTHMVAQQCGLGVKDFVWTGGDVHLYDNHLPLVAEQLQRKPLPAPRLVIKRRPESISGYELADFEFANYEYHPHIKAPVAV